MDHYNEEFANKIAKSSIKKFDSLGKNGKPKNGECAFLACILKEERPESVPCFNIEVVALGTGSKCNGESREILEGNILRDSHAEVIARRAFKIYLLAQIELAINEKDSIFDFCLDGLKLKKNVSFHFYCSHTPCGDASILPKEPTTGTAVLSMNGTSYEPEASSLPKKRKLDESVSIDINNDIYRTGAKCAPGEVSDSKVTGINYHAIGSLRVKPGRGDPTLSHSCSDKIFKWTVLGIQGALLTLFLSEPIYLKTVTIGSYMYNYNSFHRAIFSRFEEKCNKLKFISSFKIVTPKLLNSDILFKYCRSEICTEPSFTTLIWSKSTVHKNGHEVSIEGKRLGTTKKTINSLKSQVSVCRNQLFRKVILLIKILVLNPERLKQISTNASNYFENGSECLSNSAVIVTLRGEAIKNSSMPNTIKVFKAINNFVKTPSVLDNVTYGELKEAAVSYQLMWETLKAEVLINWTKKNENLKCFKVKLKD